MKRIALFGVLFVLLVSGCVQPEGGQINQHDPSIDSTSEVVCNLYIPLVVLIDTKFADGKERNGSGFIIGEGDNEFYIVTADHVVQAVKAGDDKNEKTYVNATEIKISFSSNGDIPRNAKVIIGDPTLDVALLRVDKKAESETVKINWDELSWCSEWKKETPVWFIGWKGQSWNLPPEPGKLLNRGEVFINTIQPGNSGTPFITQDCGIASMVIRDDGGTQSVQAVDIVQIKNFVTSNGSTWNLHEKTEVSSLLSEQVTRRAGRITIIWTESSLELAQKISAALKKTGFEAELKEYGDWAPNVRSNLPNKYDRPGIMGNKLFYFSATGQSASVRKIGSIVQPLLKNSQLAYRRVPEVRIIRGLTIDPDEFLIVLNESRSFWGQLFN